MLKQWPEATLPAQLRRCPHGDALPRQLSMDLASCRGAVGDGNICMGLWEAGMDDGILLGHLHGAAAVRGTRWAGSHLAAFGAGWGAGMRRGTLSAPGPSHKLRVAPGPGWWH